MHTNKSGLRKICNCFRIEFAESDSLKILAIKINDKFGYCKVSVAWNGAVNVRHETIKENLRFRNEIIQESKALEMVVCKGCLNEFPVAKFTSLVGCKSLYCTDCRELRRLRRKEK